MFFFYARTSTAVDYTAYTSPCLPRVRIICTCAISVLNSVKKSKVSCFRNFIQQGQRSAALINLYMVAAKPFYRKLLFPPSLKEKHRVCCLMAVRPFVHPSILPFIQPKPHGPHNSSATELIHSKSSSLESALAVNVQRYRHLPMGTHGRAHGRNNASSHLADPVTQQPLGGFIPNQVHWNRIGLKMFNVIGLPSGAIGASGMLRMPELSNHLADSLQIRFIATVFTCR